KEWEQEKEERYSRVEEVYHREPFAADVSEGKNDPIYNAHSYHTKCPYKAIMRFILYYTRPGDLVLDSFAGTGMTGVAAHMCGDKQVVSDLGYHVADDGGIYEKNGNELKRVSELGPRRSLLIDLSPAASLISYNFNANTDVLAFKTKGARILSELKNRYGWMYKTLHSASEEKIGNLCEKISEARSGAEIESVMDSSQATFGNINYIVWSHVYSCPNCGEEMNYYDFAYHNNQLKAATVCISCDAQVPKSELERVWITKFDPIAGQPVRMLKEIPVLINYSAGKKRMEKRPDEFDLLVADKVATFVELQGRTPIHKLQIGEKTGEPLRVGVDAVYKFYSARNLIGLVDFLYTASTLDEHLRNFWHGSVLPKLTKMNRYMPQHGSRALVGPMANTLYLPPLFVENNFINQLEFQFKKLLKGLGNRLGNCISTQSGHDIDVQDDTFDYIFLDPPFASNIMYSELNYIRESWMRIFTATNAEVIENKTQSKGLGEYKSLLSSCLSEAYRVLKHGRWITMEFSNTKATVWNIIQQALQEAGFVIAGVDLLDKKRGGFHSMIGTIAVKQDLVISAYKPSKTMVEQMKEKENTEESAWIFTRNHLKQLPVFVGRKGEAEPIVERTPRMLFDRMVAYHVQNGYSVPISSAEFQEGVAQRFPMRDGMAFLETQVTEYDKKRLL
ncbi:MAG: site-specific DNA-methyltransferase, partial [Bacteroidales bacterium]|nr:site-specific DNA-methyltransferase [Bacteroidales bacterium]